MEGNQKIKSETGNYEAIFQEILKEVCPLVASFLQLKIQKHPGTALNDASDTSRESPSRWYREQNISSDSHICLQVEIKNEYKPSFNKAMSSCYREKGKYIVFDLLVERILEEIASLMSAETKNVDIQISYSKDAMDILNRSVMDFMHYIKVPVLHGINYISSMPYESRPCKGQMLFINNCSEKLNIIRFEHGISFRETNYRIIRKILQISEDSKYVLYDTCTDQIIGLANKDNPIVKQKGLFKLTFKGHMHWELSCGNKTAVQYENGIYYIIKDLSLETECADTLACFYDGNEEKITRAAALIKNLSRQTHGAMAIISSNAAGEAERLSENKRGIKITPPIENFQELQKWVLAFSSIDGALMLDEDLNCYAIGVLLDGPSFVGDISRGARYNSALSYVNWRNAQNRERTLAVVVSEDRPPKIINPSEADKDTKI